MPVMTATARAGTEAAVALGFDSESPDEIKCIRLVEHTQISYGQSRIHVDVYHFLIHLRPEEHFAALCIRKQKVASLLSLFVPLPLEQGADSSVMSYVLSSLMGLVSSRPEGYTFRSHDDDDAEDSSPPPPQFVDKERYLRAILDDGWKMLKTPEDEHRHEILQVYMAVGWAKKELARHRGWVWTPARWSDLYREARGLHATLYRVLCDAVPQTSPRTVPRRFHLPATLLPKPDPRDPNILVPRAKVHIFGWFLIASQELGMSIADMARAARQASLLDISSADIARAFAEQNVARVEGPGKRAYLDNVYRIVLHHVEHFGNYRDEYDIHEHVVMKRYFLPWETYEDACWRAYEQVESDDDP